MKGSKTEVDIPANTIYGTPTKSGIYSAQVIAKTAGGAKASAILPLIVRAENERIIKVDCDAKMGKVSGGGVFADGKSACVGAAAGTSAKQPVSRRSNERSIQRSLHFKEITPYTRIC